MNTKESEKRKRLESPIHKSLLEPLGKIVANFNRLEFELTHSFNFLIPIYLEHNEVTQILIEGLSFEQKLNLFQSLYYYYFGKEKRFNELKERIFKVKKGRNNYVHSNWYGAPVKDNAEFPEISDSSMRMKFDRGSVKKGEARYEVEKNETSGNLIKVANEIAEVTDELHKLNLEIISRSKFEEWGIRNRFIRNQEHLREKK